MDLARIRKKQKEEKDRSKHTHEEPAPEKEPEKALIPVTNSAVSPDEDKPDAPVDTLTETEAAGVSSQETTGGDAGEAEAVQIAELLIFNVANEDYAFRVSDIHEILRPHGITRVPGVDPSILGITALRGKVIPVIDLKKKLLISSEPDDNSGSFKVLILKGAKGPIGAMVDRGIDVIRIPEDDIIPPPSHLSEEESRFIEGLAPFNDRFYSIVRAEGVLDFDMRRMSGLPERRRNERKA